MNLAMITLLVAMGDPNFLPSNPAAAKQDPKLDSMVETTGDLNKIDQNESKQLQEQEYNRNEETLDYELDDAFKEATGDDQVKKNKKEDL